MSGDGYVIHEKYHYTGCSGMMCTMSITVPRRSLHLPFGNRCIISTMVALREAQREGSVVSLSFRRHGREASTC